MIGAIGALRVHNAATGIPVSTRWSHQAKHAICRLYREIRTDPSSDYYLGNEHGKPVPVSRVAVTLELRALVAEELANGFLDRHGKWVAK